MRVTFPLRYIVGVDPGDSTGVVVLYLGDKSVTLFNAIQMGPDDSLDWLEGFVKAAVEAEDGVLMACERYTVTPETGKRTQQPTALNVIGVVKRIATQHGLSVIMQPPGDAKAFAPNERLKQLGFFTLARDVGKPDANDVNDAARHAVLLLARTRATLFDAIMVASGS